MANPNNPLADGLLQAIKAETEGYHFYMMAARSTEDGKGRSVFEQLALEEYEHIRFLKHQYHCVLEKGAADSDERLGKKLDLVGASPIFSDDLKQRTTGAHYEMTALSIGIRLELDAMNFYRAQAASHPDPAVKKFFEELAGWEMGHYEALLRQHESLKQDYWGGGGFQPF